MYRWAHAVWNSPPRTVFEIESSSLIVLKSWLEVETHLFHLAYLASNNRQSGHDLTCFATASEVTTLQ